MSKITFTGVYLVNYITQIANYEDLIYKCNCIKVDTSIKENNRAKTRSSDKSDINKKRSIWNRMSGLQRNEFDLCKQVKSKKVERDNRNLGKK